MTHQDIAYLNTDLELSSLGDLTALAQALERSGLCVLGVSRDEQGQWLSTLETLDQYESPAETIAALLTVIEALPESLQADWQACCDRIFDIGYLCGSQPWAFTQSLPHELLTRIVGVGAALKLTLYPPEQAAD